MTQSFGSTEKGAITIFGEILEDFLKEEATEGVVVSLNLLLFVEPFKDLKKVQTPS